MRGKDESQETKMQVFGITPAYAGKSEELEDILIRR